MLYLYQKRHHLIWNGFSSFETNLTLHWQKNYRKIPLKIYIWIELSYHIKINGDNEHFSKLLVWIESDLNGNLQLITTLEISQSNLKELKRQFKLYAIKCTLILIKDFFKEIQIIQGVQCIPYCLSLGILFVYINLIELK